MVFYPRTTRNRRYRRKTTRKPYKAKKTIYKRRGMKKYSMRARYKNIQVMGQGGQVSKFTAVNRRIPRSARLMKQLHASNYWYNNYAGRVTAGVGVASIFSTSLLGSGAFTTTPSYDTDLPAIQYKVAGAITGQSKASRFLIESAYHDFRITNQDLGNVEIHIYDVSTKSDCSLSPQQAVYDGLNDESDATFGFGTAKVPIGMNPTQSALFNQYYRVKQHSRIILAQGQSHSHTVYVKPMRVFNSEVLSEASISVKGLSMWTMIVVSGLPQNDSTTKTQVSTGNCALDIVTTKTIKYTWSSDTNNSYFYTNNLPNAFTVGENIVNIGSGAIGSGATPA